MDPSSEPDIEALFAPLPRDDAFGAVLSEANDVLPQVRRPIDAELWGSDLIGALSRSAEDMDPVMRSIAAGLVPVAEQTATAPTLALLRIFGAIGTAELSGAAVAAADRVAAAGVAEPDWAAAIGKPQIGQCWSYADTGGRQESVTLTFRYGPDEHALSVLIDHVRGGKIKDAWADDATGLLARTRAVAASDSRVGFEMIEAPDAGRRLEQAIVAGECPEQPDQADGVAAHRALLHARVALLS